MNKILVTTNSIRVSIFKIKLYYKEQRRHVKEKEEHGCIKSRRSISHPSISVWRRNERTGYRRVLSVTRKRPHRLYIKSHSNLYFLCMHLSPLSCNFFHLNASPQISLPTSFGFVQVSAVVLYTQNRFQFITGSNRERLVQLWKECYKHLCVSLFITTQQIKRLSLISFWVWHQRKQSHGREDMQKLKNDTRLSISFLQATLSFSLVESIVLLDRRHTSFSSLRSSRNIGSATSIVFVIFRLWVITSNPCPWPRAPFHFF